MTYDIKLKTGFFKTQPYLLILDQGQIILTPHAADDNSRLVIDAGSIRSISLTADEFEIITDVLYTGRLSNQTDVNQLSYLLAKEFGDKFIFQHE